MRHVWVPGGRQPQVWVLWEAVVPGNGVVKEAVVWHDSQTYRLQLTPK